MAENQAALNTASAIREKENSEFSDSEKELLESAQSVACCDGHGGLRVHFRHEIADSVEHPASGTECDSP